MSAVIDVDEAVMAQPLLDDGQIGALRDALGLDELREMYADLPDSARNAVAQIEKATGAADLDQVRKSAHILKGVASSFGALRLSSLAQALELGVSTTAEAGEYLPVLRKVLEQTLTALCQVTGSERLTGVQT